MRREILLVLIIVVAAGVAWWWMNLNQSGNPVPKCPRECTYGCIPQTSTCRVPQCPSNCKLGCINGTAQCKPSNVSNVSNVSVTPKVGRITACGMVNETSLLDSTLYSDGTCLTINNDAIILDCNDNAIMGSTKPGSYGIYIKGRKNVTLRNCIITNYSSGIMVDSSSEIYISRTSSIENSNAGIIANSSRNMLLSNMYTSENPLGFWLVSSLNITLDSVQVTSNTVGMKMESSQDIKLFNSEACESSLDDMICESSVVSASTGSNCKVVDGCIGIVCLQCTHTDPSDIINPSGGNAE
ncbi:MAG: right-handed parallel beta-helix repeat-containing protein [Candidatus Micrarchaeota archaeon]|nr:right-handed parallel beta-helix repeat-containing protein [Candidatus Micrarchaeota archaeon]